MNHSLKIVLFVLLLCGVFGADEVKPVSVMEGDSVTLTPDPAKIQGFVKLQWRFGETLIAQTRGTKSTTEYEDIFRDRLQLDHQTGSLTFKNMRTKHSGLYQLQIDYSNDVSYIKFSVTVKESPSFDAIEFVMKTESVKKGDPVTLDVPQIQGDELIVWRFGDEGKIIAKTDLEAKSSPLYYDEGFRDRLKLDQTGSLTITNTRTTDSGLYTAKISSNKQTSYKRFIVTVNSGYSGGAVAGIVVGVLLAVAVAAGVMYYLRPRTTNLPSQTLTVPVGYLIILIPDTEIQRGDKMQWLFGDKETLIAVIKGQTRKMTTYDGPDMIFQNRLKQDRESGSLIITAISAAHTGLYTLKIRRCRETLYKRFFVDVKDEEKLVIVMKGQDATLSAEKKEGDEILWMFGDDNCPVAKNTTEEERGENCYKRFEGRVKLNDQTGDLTIKKVDTDLTGTYKLKIIRNSKVLFKKFSVTLSDEETLMKVMEGQNVTLSAEIKKGDKIFWMFGEDNYILAKNTTDVSEEEMVQYCDPRFTDLVNLNDQTGDLTIKKISADITGKYNLKIIRNGEASYKTFSVTLSDSRGKQVNESATVVMPLLDGDYVNVMNEEEGTSSL